MKLDAFIDLTTTALAPADLARMVSAWSTPESLGSVAERVAIRLRSDAVSVPDVPSGWSAVRAQSSVGPLADAMLVAGRGNRLLLVLFGPVVVSAEAIAVLAHDLSADPMFGSAIARIGCHCGRSVLSLAGSVSGGTSWIPRKALASVPSSDIIPESVSVCTLISAAILGNFEALDDRFSCAASALLHCLADARRRGFRTVLSNRAVVAIDGMECAEKPSSVVPLTVTDALLLRRLVPEVQLVWDQSRSASLERFERLSTPAPGSNTTRPSLLIDVRNVVALFNGTSQAALGLVESLHRLGPDWDVTLLANQQGTEFHQLETSYPGWAVCTTLPARGFDVALRPTQPWSLQELIDLHSCALVNIYLMLDTIAWDIGHLAPNLEEVWWFLAEHADAIWFDSEFTRRRFHQRFPAEPRAPDDVVHFSFDPAEYRNPQLKRAVAETDAILVVGNSHHHKDVPRTVEMLAAAFPFRQIRVLGPSTVTSSFVESFGSGGLSDYDVHRLYATARCVIFPSFYEGFGFPIVTALAYGRPVFARRSELIDELAARIASPGQLFVFDRREELVDLLGRFLHGERLPSVPLGGAASGQVRRWRDVAEQIVASLRSFMHTPVGAGWFERDRAVRQLQTYRGR